MWELCRELPKYGGKGKGGEGGSRTRWIEEWRGGSGRWRGGRGGLLIACITVVSIETVDPRPYDAGTEYVGVSPNQAGIMCTTGVGMGWGIGGKGVEECLIYLMKFVCVPWEQREEGGGRGGRDNHT